VGSFFFGSRDNNQKLNLNEKSLSLDLHEEIIHKIGKRFEIENDIRNVREEFDSIVNSQSNKVRLLFNS